MSVERLKKINVVVKVFSSVSSSPNEASNKIFIEFIIIPAKPKPNKRVTKNL
jgi:hypothetical protein